MLARLAVSVFVAVLNSLFLSFSPSAQTAEAIGRCMGGDSSAPSDELRVLINQCSKAIAEPSLRADQKAAILVTRGVAYRNLVDLKRSLADLDRAVKMAPNSPDASRMRAWTLREMRRSRAAEVEYDRALKLETHWQGYLSRCVVRIDLRKYRVALEDCEKALALDRNVDALYFTGMLRSVQGNPGEAIPLLEEASLLDQAPSRVFVELANAYHKIGERAAARRSLNQGLLRFPDDLEMNRLSSTLGE